ncbi:hypothetical protein [Rhizobium mayense]|uniref:Uncharacterized protein n=1 Tax=Rhizobium mayense TaxID=1312184 RepID=A0ABT7JY46_9HYPH|nr:hypothetical protein [Rhizobium mayense]MDL2401265.1 hypothetical protein [Rhizobium mayense]
MRLTGRYRYRIGWRGTLVLQVEEEYDVYRSLFSRRQPGNDSVKETERNWRDARVEDLPLQSPTLGFRSGTADTP